MKRTLLAGLLLSCNPVLAQEQPSAPMDVDALSREMAINAKAIQQQAMKDPTKLVMRTQAEQITDEQHEQAQIEDQPIN